MQICILCLSLFLWIGDEAPSETEGETELGEQVKEDTNWRQGALCWVYFIGGDTSKEDCAKDQITFW